MLDQNTDRMWYVIGAVIVGAALIFLMNGTFPTLFANIGDTFEDKVEQSTEMTDGILPAKRKLLPEHLKLWRAELVEYHTPTNTWTLDLNIVPPTNMFSAGFQTKDKEVVIPYGSTYTISYEVWSPVDVTAVPDINARPMEGEMWNQHDHDNQETRRYNGQQAVKGVDYAEIYAPFKAIPVPANEWTTVTFSYTNSSPGNVDKVAVYDYSDLGVKNDTGKVLRIKMRNIISSVK